MQNENLITYKGAKWLLLFVFYMQFLVSELVRTPWSLLFEGLIPQYEMIICIQLFAVILPCAVFMLLNSAKPSQVFKHKKLPFTIGVICAVIGISAQPIASLLNAPIIMLLENSGMSTMPTITAPANIYSLLTGLLVVALLPAIFEEVLMRGILLHAMEHDGYRFTMFVSAFLFALIHNSMTDFFGIFFLGITLCYVVWMTQSLLAGIITHFFFNAFAVVLAYTAPSESLYITVAIISIAVFGLTTSLIVHKSVKRYKSTSFFKKLFFTVISFPVVLIILGFIMFNLAKLLGVLV